MTKVVVFGAAGFVGRNMVLRLQREKDVEFTGTDIVDSPFESGVNYVKSDVLSYDEVKKVVQGADTVLHLAASPLTVSLQNPRQNMKINIEGSLNILDAAREVGVKKVVFSSASSVVGEVRYNPVDEAHPATPKTPYAVAKRSMEDYLRVYQEIFGLNYLVFRFFNVYGPWQYPQSGALVPLIYAKLTKGEPFTIMGDGSATRDFIYVEDVVDFIMQGVRKDVKNDLVNLGTGKPTSVMDLVKLSSSILGVTPNLVYKPKRPGEIDNFTADTTKLQRLFNKTPSTSLDDGLQRTFNWLKQLK